MDCEPPTEGELDPASLPPPPEGELLGPEWYAAFSIYWRPKCRQQKTAILQTIHAAMYAATPERAVYLLQQALRSLGLAEIQIIKLILLRYIYHVRRNTQRPAQQIAAEVLETLSALKSKRSKRKTVPANGSRGDK